MVYNSPFKYKVKVTIILESDDLPKLNRVTALFSNQKLMNRFKSQEKEFDINVMSIVDSVQTSIGGN